MLEDNSRSPALGGDERRRVLNELHQSDESVALKTLLTRPQEYLAGIWKDAAESLLKQFDTTKDTLLVLHAAYYHTGREDFISAVNTDVLKTLADHLDVTAVVTLIDDLDDVVARLSVPGGVWHWRPKARPDTVSAEKWQAQQRSQRIQRAWPCVSVA